MAVLNNEKPKSSQIILEQEGKFYTGKQAVNILVRLYLYAETSDLQIPTDRKREIREEQHAGPDHQEEPGMNSLLPSRNQRMLALTTRKNQGWTLSCQPGIRGYWHWPPGWTRDELCLANQESEDAGTDHQEEPGMNSVLPTRNQRMLALTTRKNQGWTLSCQPGIRGCLNDAEAQKGPWSPQHNKWVAPTSSALTRRRNYCSCSMMDGEQEQCQSLERSHHDSYTQESQGQVKGWKLPTSQPYQLCGKTDRPPYQHIKQPTRGRLKISLPSAQQDPWKDKLNYRTICPNPFYQSRPSPLANEDKSQECASKCQGLQTEAAALSHRGSHWCWRTSTVPTDSLCDWAWKLAHLKQIILHAQTGWYHCRLS